MRRTAIPKHSEPPSAALPSLESEPVLRPPLKWAGGKRWQVLHRLIYASAIAGVIHYMWLVKADLTKPLQYGAILGVLLLYRIVVWIKPKPGRGKVVVRNVGVSEG